MRRLLAVLFLMLLSDPAFAQARPWEADAGIGEAAMAVAQADGIPALRAHVDKMEAALARAPAAYAAAEKGENGKRYVLTDGLSDTMLALITASVRDKEPVEAVNNPYLQIAFLLGSYYVETHDFQNALRALDAGLALPGMGVAELGETLPMLLTERGATLGQLKRYADAVASYERVIALTSVESTIRAVALRGRAINLIDLGRLDEAEADLRSSLKFSPDHPVALSELKYIDGLRAGKKPTGTIIQQVEPNSKAN